MVRIKENKHLTENKAIEVLPAPAKVFIPLIQHLGKICNPEVKVGDQVKLGQRIGSIDARVYAPVHASISGKVAGLQDYAHPVLGRARAVIIEKDDQSQDWLIKPKSQEEADSLDVEKIRKIILEAGIVGMGGASFPTHIKLNPAKPVDTLIINAAECEPYLSCDYRLIIEKTRELFSGIKLAAKCLGVKNIYIGIEENKPEAIKKLTSFQSLGFSVKALKSDYPQGGEKQLIENILGKQIPRGKLPFDIGAVVQNIATIYAIYEAVYKDKPLYERVVTVAGSCIQNPKNLLVRLGTPLRDLIQFCSPSGEAPAKIIAGGPMMGIAQFNDEAPVIKSTNGVLLLNKQESKVLEEDVCIRCGACVRGCPAGLMPCSINLAAERKLWNITKDLGALDCIECGVCSYVCPANRRLVQSIKRAKLEAVK